ncbi:hypothetical protein [Streptomyces sp. NPDC006638]|uniref:hypothetical protein n=1 Tax=Streptomyces sp. NPDC006638 TaxID=3157183 RepID=UPI0033A99051
MKTRLTRGLRDLTSLQKKAAVAVLFLLLVLFPGLIPALAVPAAAVLVWMSAQPVLVGAVAGGLVVCRVRTSRTGGAV